MTKIKTIDVHENEGEDTTQQGFPPTWKERNDVIGIEDFFALWPTEEAALTWYENHRWRRGLFCPRCGGTSCYRVKSGKPLSHRCRQCKKYFSVKIGTPLEHSNLSVRKFLLYIHQFLTESKGGTTDKMHQSVRTGFRTSWFLGQRVRVMAEEPDTPMLEGIVQIDETYFGGKWRFMHEGRKRKLGHWMVNKIPVIGAIDAEGRVIVRKMEEDTARERVNFVLAHVKPGSEVWTDGHPAYRVLPMHGYVHKWVDHKSKEYVGEDGVTVNAMEGHWSQLKRKYHGIHHWLSPEHSQLYLDETTYRNNLGPGNGPASIGKLLDQAEGRTLPWKKLVSGEYREKVDQG